MRTLALWRLVATLLLAAIPLASLAIVTSAPVALADDHGNDDDGNRGHGNDPDGVDDDNPGNSGEKKDKKQKDEPVEAIPAGYVVDVACAPDDDGTTCVFTATAPQGGKKVGFLQVPDDAICASVVDTDAKRAEPDSHTHLPGYVSSGGDKETVTIAFDGAVTTGGTATYWIKAASAVFPVTGPGLTCDLAAASDATVTVQFDVTPAATEAPATGTIVVTVLACAGVPADTTDFDWFGQCQPASGPPRDFSLTPGDGRAAITASTDDTGEATFAELAPGDYGLDLVGGSWCHAASDRVTTASEVIVEAGATSRVWIFTCDARGGV